MLDLIVLHGEFSLFTVRGNFWLRCTRRGLTKKIYAFLKNIHTFSENIYTLKKNIYTFSKTYVFWNVYICGKTYVFRKAPSRTP